MLKRLNVQNFALIDHAEINFERTFIVITGETGAGKSILLNALSIVLGGKVDNSILFDKSKKSIIEATFDVSSIPLKDIFADNDIDYADETILRREIATDGKTRAFINDTPVNISVLKTIGALLIDIHSQHQNLLINSQHFHYNFIDAIAGILQERSTYTSLFKRYQKEKKELDDLLHQQASAQKEIDYYQYLFKEIEELNLREGELLELEDELQQLENAESIIQQLSTSIQLLQSEEINVIHLLTQAKNNLQSVAKYHPKYAELSERLQTNIIDIKDIAHEIETQLNTIEINPNRIETLTHRIDAINSLLKKHHVKTDTELLQVYNDLQNKLSSYETLDENIEAKKKELTILEKQLVDQAERLSEKRKAIKLKIEDEIKLLLKDLAMPNAQFVVDIHPQPHLEEYTEFGKDKIHFLFSANKGIEPAELQKVASGGEMARLMLSIKSLMAKKIALPTIIFDEIDTGTSGSVAAKMGDIMRKMSESMQVIVITHLPQIASKGKQHLYVSKEDRNNRTVSTIRTLNENDRILEIAKMLSNDQPTEAALQNAKELLNQN